MGGQTHSLCFSSAEATADYYVSDASNLYLFSATVRYRIVAMLTLWTHYGNYRALRHQSVFRGNQPRGHSLLHTRKSDNVKQA